MFPDGYAGLQPIADDQANLCLLTSRARVHRCAGQRETALPNPRADSPHLRRRLAGASRPPARAATAYRVPYGFVYAPSATDPPSVFRLGGQVGVIPSFAGDGMSIALHRAHQSQRATTSRDCRQAPITAKCSGISPARPGARQPCTGSPATRPAKHS